MTPLRLGKLYKSDCSLEYEHAFLQEGQWESAWRDKTLGNVNIAKDEVVLLVYCDKLGDCVLLNAEGKLAITNTQWFRDNFHEIPSSL